MSSAATNQPPSDDNIGRSRREMDNVIRHLGRAALKLEAGKARRLTHSVHLATGDTAGRIERQRHLKGDIS